MCGIVGLLVKKPALRDAARRAHGADADRHDRARAGFGGPGRVHRAAAGRAAQVQPLFGSRKTARLRLAAAARELQRAHLGVDAKVDVQGQPRRPHVRRSRRQLGEALAAGSTTRSCTCCPSAASIDLYKDIGKPARGRAAATTSATSAAPTWSATRAWPPNRRSPRPTRIRSRPARTSAWCTTARCRTRTRSGRKLEPLGIHFETDNDTEAACRFLEWRMREGDDLETALQKGFDELDGFYTFLMGTPDRARAGARRVRLQAGGRGRDRRLRRHLLRVPLARASAGREAREHLRTQARGDLLMASLMSPRPRRWQRAPTGMTFDLARQAAARAQPVPAPRARRHRRAARHAC